MKDLDIVKSTALYPQTRTIGKVEKVLDTTDNLKWLLNFFHTEVKYNLMKRRREIYIPDHYFFEDDADNDILSRIENIATLNFFPTKKIDQHLNVIAGENAYHPIVDFFKKTFWDGVPRLDKFIDCLVTDNPELTRKIVKTWMVAAVEAACSKSGFTNQGILVLQGPQGIGKTRWVKSLDPINCDAVKESAFLDPTSKDSVFQLACYWISELGELEAIFKKSDIGRLKSFVTTQTDFIRLPYARKPTHLPRRSVYVATVNDKNFLSDDTGNRRWWTVPLINIEPFPMDQIPQVWAEVWELAAKNHLTYLDGDTQCEVNELNKEHERIDPFEEKLLSHYDWQSTARKALTASQVLEELGYRNTTRGDATRMGNILTKVNKNPGYKSNGLKLHQVPISIILPNRI